APPPPPSTEDENLPPWLREGPKREMLQGETLSIEWLSSADKLVESVDTELTYDEWYALQKEIARPKSIEEDVSDLLADIPPETVEGTGPLVGTGELPDWFLGLEELDTSDAPDWLIGAPEPVAAEPEATPSWISEVEETPPEKEEDSVNDFFSSLNQGPTLPSGESMDDLFGEFAMPAPGAEAPEDQEELPALDWVTGQADVAEASENYGAAEMEDFFSNLSQTASETASKEAEVPPLDWLTKAEETEEEPAGGLESYLSSLEPALTTDEIEEPDLDLFTGPQSAAYPLPDIEIEQEEEPPLTHDPGAYTEETMSWLNELQGIVSAVTRDEEEEVVAPSDEFFSTPEDKAAFEEPAVGRGDEFEWPEPEPIEEPEPEESDWLSQLGAVTGTSEMEITQLDESDDDRPMPKLTGMLNRMRMAEEPPAQEEPSALFEDLPDREEPPSADDHLESLFMTEDLLSEASTGFDSPPAQQETPAESEASGFGDDLSFDLDSLMSDTPSQESAAQDEVDFNAKSEASGFGDDLSFDLDSLMSDAPSQESSAQDEVDFNLDDVLADLPSASQGSEEWGASSEEDTASDEGDSFNF